VSDSNIFASTFAFDLQASVIKVILYDTLEMSLCMLTLRSVLISILSSTAPPPVSLQFLCQTPQYSTGLKKLFKSLYPQFPPKSLIFCSNC